MLELADCFPNMREALEVQVNAEDRRSPEERRMREEAILGLPDAEAIVQPHHRGETLS